MAWKMKLATLFWIVWALMLSAGCGRMSSQVSSDPSGPSWTGEVCISHSRADDRLRIWQCGSFRFNQWKATPGEEGEWSTVASHDLDLTTILAAAPAELSPRRLTRDEEAMLDSFAIQRVSPRRDYPIPQVIGVLFSEADSVVQLTFNLQELDGSGLGRPTYIYGTPHSLIATLVIRDGHAIGPWYYAGMAHKLQGVISLSIDRKASR